MLIVYNEQQYNTADFHVLATAKKSDQSKQGKLTKWCNQLDSIIASALMFQV